MVSRTARAHPQPYRGQRRLPRDWPKPRPAALLAKARFNNRIERARIAEEASRKYIEVLIAGGYWIPIPKRSAERLADLWRGYFMPQVTEFEARLMTHWLKGRIGRFRVRVILKDLGEPHWHCWFVETVGE